VNWYRRVTTFLRWTRFAPPRPYIPTLCRFTYDGKSDGPNGMVSPRSSFAADGVFIPSSILLAPSLDDDAADGDDDDDAGQ
jgi:hypothetical protein